MVGFEEVNDEYAAMIVEAFKHHPYPFRDIGDVYAWGRDYITIVTVDEQPAIAVWWNKPNPANMCVHFCAFPNAYGNKAREASKAFLDVAQSLGNDCIQTVVNSNNALSRKFVKDVGFKEVGVIPAYYGEYGDGIIIWLERDYGRSN